MKTLLLTTIAFLALTITCNAQWTTSGTSIVPVSGNLGYNVGVGTATPNANLETQATTEQLRLSYDATHFASFTTSSLGNLTIDPTGNITLIPSQSVNISSNNNTSLILDAPTSYTSFMRIRTGTTGSISDFSINAGTGSTNNLRFINNKSTNTIMTLASNDYIGVGTTTPTTLLDVLGASASTGFRSLNSTALGTASGGGLLAATPAIPTAADQRLGLVGFGGIYYGSTYRYPSQISSFSSEAWSSSNAGSYLTFSTSTSGTVSAIERMRIDNAGNVGIGTLNPDAKLAVNGTIHSKAVTVDLIGWSDFVFKPTYQLPTLTEVKTYIDKNQHLPGVPAAAEVEKNGLNLGEMNKILLQKVEELTLYLIEKDKQLQEQQKTNQAFKQQLDYLTEQLKALKPIKNNR